MTLTQFLTQVKEREEKATKGPWYDKNTENEYADSCSVVAQPDIEEPEFTICDSFNSDSINVDKDIRFIAHARTDIPKLLKLVEKLIEQRNEYFVYARFPRDEEQVANAELEKLLEEG